MTWKVVHTKNIVDVRCVPMEECEEVLTKEKTVMCYSTDCGKMPYAISEEWWFEGTRRDDTCNTEAGPIECLKSKFCSWVRIWGDDSYRCMFYEFASQLGAKLMMICPRPFQKYPTRFEEGGPTAEEFAVAKPAVEKVRLAAVNEVPTTCGECVDKTGYSWKVVLYASSYTTAKYETSCVPTEECEENTSLTQTILCFPLHCSSLKPTNYIRDWWTEQVTEYTQCAPYMNLEYCSSDEECVYVEQDILTGYCIFKQFADYFGMKDKCGHRY